MQRAGRRLCAGQGYRQDGVSPQIGFIVRAVCLNHQTVNLDLLQSIAAAEQRGQLFVDVFHRMAHAQPKIPGLRVPQFHRLKAAGAGAGRHCRQSRMNMSVRLIPDGNFRLHGGISPGIQNFPTMYLDNLQKYHNKSLLFRVHAVCALRNLLRVFPKRGLFMQLSVIQRPRDASSVC